MFKQLHSLLVSGVLLSSVSTVSQALMIDITPNFQSVFVGESVSVDIVASDVSNAGGLGDFDFDLSFDDSILNFDSVTFGTGLGFGLQDSSALGGSLNINEVSFESEAYLLANQADSFILATINFTASAIGLSDVAFDSIWALGDAGGNAIDPFNTSNASIEVLQRSASVPEPSALALLSLGLGLMVLRHRKSA